MVRDLNGAYGLNVISLNLSRGAVRQVMQWGTSYTLQ